MFLYLLGTGIAGLGVPFIFWLFSYPTAEKVFHRYNNYDVRSAGTEEGARNKVTQGHIGWADLIFVMEKKHLRRLKEKFGQQLQNKTVHCIDITDDYGFMDEELIEILKTRVSEFIEVPD